MVRKEGVRKGLRRRVVDISRGARYTGVWSEGSWRTRERASLAVRALWSKPSADPRCVYDSAKRHSSACPDQGPSMLLCDQLECDPRYPCKVSTV